MAAEAAMDSDSLMAWTRLDDGFYANPKIMALSGNAFRTYVVTLNWSASQLTDGNISPQALKAFGSESDADELEAAGLWIRNGVGWVIHDFEEYQETKAQHLARKAQAKARKDRWKDKNASRNASPEQVLERVPVRVRNSAPTQPNPITEPKGSASRDDPLFVAFYEYWMRKAYVPGRTTMTKSERGRINAAVAEAREAGITSDEVKIRGRKYRKDWPKMEHTPQALLGNWTRFEPVEERGLPDCKKCGNRRIVPVDGDESTASEFRRCSCVGVG